MCATCGCDGAEPVIRLLSGDDHPHADGHGHDHGHEHVVASAGRRTVELQEKVLAKNDDLARANREWLRRRGVFMLNLMSSPGSGKTTLLERTARDLAGQVAIAVIEGDQETMLDAKRIQSAGCRVVQINTGSGCHLDAAMVASALAAIDPVRGSIVVVENVGNLVCPALFDLGEAARVVLASVAEGGDKPMKYPHMFRQADLVLGNKIDLLPYVDFDPERYLADLAKVSPAADLTWVSAVTGKGMRRWYEWLLDKCARAPGLVPGPQRCEKCE